ncbi:stage II sporulation protein D [Desulfolucanica intricata]|uniref:stage II sporulation protein D n=1 Tax=Desulfolucanica intricata TaxID=1285191 RepID=UPI00350E4F8D
MRVRKLFAAAVILIIGIVIGLPAMVSWLMPDRIKAVGTVVRMYSHKDNKIHSIPLEEYLVGVVAAEMPGEFPEEALKAQAVAARTYVLKRLQGGGVSNSTHPGADVCDDHRHSQAWISREEMKKRWGLVKYYRCYHKIKKAVADTTGMVITYDGSLIDPVYHSSCGGVGTENSEDVWKFEVPYLRSATCPYEDPNKSKRTVEISLAGIGEKLGVDLTALPVSTGSSLFTVVEKTETGRPRLIKIGEKEIPAVELRNLLGLRSTSFTWQPAGDKLKITTTGYGHGVGMCQYGAKGFAEQGKDFEEILTHYYKGVKIVRLKDS